MCCAAMSGEIKIMNFNINKLIAELSNRRKLFVSEADFQLELAWLIKELYPSAVVRMEYSPKFDTNMHIDILVIIEDKWIPIELKYKTKGCQKLVDGEFYQLKNHSAKDVNCYAYLKDIQRIERIKKNVPAFQEGYTVLITNELSYTKTPMSKAVNYYAFSIHEGAIKRGTIDWGEGTGKGTKGRNYKDPIVLNGEYVMKWSTYSMVDSSNTGAFMVLINRVL